MKKIFLSIIATVIMSSVAVYAEGGKKATKKAPAKKGCTKTNCPDKPDCKKTKTICPNRPGCICN